MDPKVAPSFNYYKKYYKKVFLYIQLFLQQY